MMNENEVVGRATYLKYRTNWANVYTALTSEIRAIKRAIRESRSIEEQAIAQSKRHYMRLQARAHMHRLEQVKDMRPERFRKAA